MHNAQPRLIYLDSAATSLQKPPQVGRSMLHAMQIMASPGRGGHRPAMLAAETVFLCRCEAAELFHVPEPERVVFTMNATHAINIAINDLVSPGERVVVSGYEHNAVTRALQLHSAQMDVAASPLFDPAAAIEAFREKLPGAKAAVVCHVSNVYGYILPIREISALCRQNGVPLLIDASQSAGCVPVDFARLDAAYIAMPGHKSLLGPQGTGILLCSRVPKPLIAGGTGSESRFQEMPLFLPDREEAGTHNVPGIAGVLEGIRWVRKTGVERILQHERQLTRRAANALSQVDGVHIFAADRPENQAGVLSFQCDLADCETLSAELGEMGIAVRGGCHCAPLAHETGGTLDTGTVRASFSPFNIPEDVDALANSVKKCLKKYEK